MRIMVAALALALACHGDVDDRAVDWTSKTAWRNCAAAIRGGASRPLPPCAALSMCANEAPLTRDEQHALAALNARAGCAPL